VVPAPVVALVVEEPEVGPEPVKKAKAVKRAAAVVTPHERAFRDAWAAFARGDMGQAAELFAQSESAVPGEPLAEDACYGRAVALDRGGRRAEAIVEMRRFLAQYPRAVRGDEVAVTLGQMLLESGEVEGGRALLERGAKSESAEIRKSAERALAR